MAWKADLHGFYQSSKNSNFTTLRFSDIDMSDDGEEKSDEGKFSKRDSDEIVDRQKFGEDSGSRYKLVVTEFDLLDLADKEKKIQGNKMFIVPSFSDLVEQFTVNFIRRKDSAADSAVRCIQKCFTTRQVFGSPISMFLCKSSIVMLISCTVYRQPLSQFCIVSG